MNWLPKNYEAPVSQGNYTKLVKGENIIRISSSAIVGWEYWTKDNKPMRSKEAFEYTPDDARLDEGRFKPKHFWAFCIWNYATKTIQIMEITQKTIQSDIKALVDNDKWGAPQGYDIAITKTGDGLETEYSTMANPHTPLDEAIQTTYDGSNINLEALYDGSDPFAKKETPTEPNRAEGEVSEEEIPMNEEDPFNPA